MATKKKLKGSDLGYRGEGVPDEDTISELQNRYSRTVLAQRKLPPEILAKHERFRELETQERLGKKIDGKALIGLTKELLPFFHFKVDDVDWDK
jgi:hypothetical protein